MPWAWLGELLVGMEPHSATAATAAAAAAAAGETKSWHRVMRQTSHTQTLISAVRLDKTVC